MSTLFVSIKMSNNSYYIPRDSWIYFKIYCNELSIDNILKNQLYPIIKKYINSEIIIKWFFVKYNIPKSHLRLRILLKNNNDYYSVTHAFNIRFKRLFKNNIIWDVSLGTYKRELNRYAYYPYELTEELFYLDSNLFIKNINDLQNEKFKLFYSIKSTFDIIKMHYNSPKDVLFFINEMECIYKNEFNVSGDTKKSLSSKYRVLKNSINELMNNENNKYLKIKKTLEKRNNKKAKLLLKYKIRDVNKFTFVNSHIHMNINRYFSQNQRLYEMMVYDFLYRYYSSIIKRNNFD